MRPFARLLAPAVLVPAVLAAQRGPSAVGTWSCSSYSPGPTLGSSGFLMVLEFTLRGDGTYQAGRESGRYSFAPASGRIQFLSGGLRTFYADTRLVPDPESGKPLVRTLAGSKRQRFDCRLRG